MERTDFSYPMRTLFLSDVDGGDDLVELALDMRWSWNHAADDLWRKLSPDLWQLTYNPMVILQTVSKDRIRRVLSDGGMRGKLDELVKARRHAAQQKGWFQTVHSDSPLKRVAYFSMEFMLSEALPIYSGGLGNVAGDQLKAANDLDMPVVGIGLLYQQGYFRQVIDREGRQQALLPFNDPGQLPIMPVYDENGEWLRIEVPLPGYSVWLRVWQVRIGKVVLYLLDSNDLANFPAHRTITGELYIALPEVRLQQEIILGLAGWRVLEALNIQPEVCHLNEGHAAFAVLERARCYMVDTGLPFEAALTVTRAGNLFTTHTPVAAGFDRFSPPMIKQYFSGYVRDMLHISFHDFLALGRQNPEDSSEFFNMAYLAVRGCGAINGVSRLHRQVSRRIFQPLFTRWPEEEIPVEYVTNGVHMPTWSSEEVHTLWTQACGEDHWLGNLEDIGEKIRTLPDEMLWECRASSRRTLVDFVRERLWRQHEVSGISPISIDEARRILSPHVLTLGFARRFAPYKRPSLLLQDPERLIRILKNPDRPVQLIVAGKAHPEDREGQEMIHQWVSFVHRPEVSMHAVFLSDYDMLLTASLVQGVDVWLNTPRRPWEACGTSGMKVLVNGGINLSELDGWWAEAYNPEVGWAIGDGREHDSDPAWDRRDAEFLYEILENEIIPLYYNRNEKGIPTSWVARMRESMADLTPVFSANRAMREYAERFYIPAAASYRMRSAEGGRVGTEILNWQRDLAGKWSELRFGTAKVETNSGKHRFTVQIYLGEIDPDSVCVELYANGIHGGKAHRLAMSRGDRLIGVNSFNYNAEVRCTRPASDFTLRIIPYQKNAVIPLEANFILWER